jgi:anti-sigma B factor antagonist
MEINKESIEGILIVRVNGRLDTVSSGEFEKKIMPLLEEGNYRVAIDFTGIDYVSSSGLRIILICAKNIKKKSGTFALFSLNNSIEEVFQISGFAKIIPIYANQAEAIEKMK